MARRTVPIAVSWQTVSPLRTPRRDLALSGGEDFTLAFTVYESTEADTPMDVEDVTAKLILSDPDSGARYMEALSTTTDAEAGRLDIPVSGASTASLSGRFAFRVEFTNLAAVNVLCEGVLNLSGVPDANAAPPLLMNDSSESEFVSTVDHGTVTGGSVTIDWTEAKSHKLTLGAATTALVLPAIPGATGLQAVVVWVAQDGAGNRYMTFPDNIMWQGGYAPSLSTAGDAVDIIQFITMNQGFTWAGAVTMQVQPSL